MENWSSQSGRKTKNPVNQPSLNLSFGLILLSAFASHAAGWSTAGTSTTTTDKVGIGTSSTTAFSAEVVATDWKALELSTTNMDSDLLLVFRPTNSGRAVLNSYGGTNGFVFTSGDPTTTGGTGLVWINSNGKVGIGTSSPSEKLDVSGNVKISGALKIGSAGWSIEAPDYVFEKTYKLNSLENVEKYIKKNKHLSEIPSAQELQKNGMDLAEMNLKLLKKVEELTLHVIEQEKRIKKLESGK